MSGKHRRNTVKTLVVTDRRGRVVFAGEHRPGRMVDVTQARSAGLVDLCERHPGVVILADAGYRGLDRDTNGAVVVPPRKPKRDATRGELDAYETARHAHSSARIPVEHGIARLKHWRCLQRHTTRRDGPAVRVEAVAALVGPREHVA